MAYEVTATRRRPRRFEDLAGQEFVTATLKNAISGGKIAHAYLFSGPRGCGKTSSARILAKALNCETGPAPTPCDVCNHCVEITKGSSLDVIEIDGASNTSVNDIRQIKDEVLFPPNSCRYKIYIIDEVHMLSTSAFNALLKTIEEPPPYVIFIFATTELHKVPATIKSRCQQFHFRLGSVEQIKDLLKKAAEETGIHAEDEALYWIAKESTGSFRDAYTLFDQVVSFSDGHVSYDKIRDKLGLVGIDRINAVCTECVQGKTDAAVEKIDEILQAGVSIEQCISNFADYFRSLLLIKSGITKEALLGQTVERYSQTVLNAWNPIQIERALSLFLQLFRDVRYSLNQRYELEVAVSRLCWLSSYVSPSEVKQSIDAVRSILCPGIQNSTSQIPAPQSSPAAPQSSPAALQSTPAVPVEKANQVQPQGFQSQQPSNIQDHQKNPNIPTFSALSSPGPFDQSGYQPAQIVPPVTAPKQEEPKEAVQPVQTQNEQQTYIKQVETIQELREAVIRELTLSNTFLATSLMQTCLWKEEKNVISATIENPFIKGKLEQAAPELNPLLSKLWGKDVQFSISLTKLTDACPKEELPAVIENICSVFKGTVTGLEKKSVYTNEQEIGEDNESF